MQKMFSDKERTLQETQVSVAKKLGEAEHKAATLQAGMYQVIKGETPQLAQTPKLNKKERERH